MSVTASEARAQLLPLLEQVNDEQEAVEIISKKGRAYLVPEYEYRAWRETMHLLTSPHNAKRLRESIEQHRRGQAQPRPLLDPDV